MLVTYITALATAPLSVETRRTYASKVRQYLAWLAIGDVDGDPLTERRARDWAVRDYRTHLATVAKRAPATINNTLAAIDGLLHPPRAGPRGR
jgi:integrase/recombinase XerC